MRRRQSTVWSACLFLLLAGPSLHADSPRNPLRFVPDQANLVLAVEQPGKIVDTFLHHEIFQRLQKIEAIAELYHSTNARRFTQLLKYFEERLGHGSLELVDRVAGGGMVLAARSSGKEPTPVLLVIQGKDEELAKKFCALAVEVIEQEMARQEGKAIPRKGSYENNGMVQLGGAHFAVVQGAILLANDPTVLKLALECGRKGGEKSLARKASLAEARKLLPHNPLAWGWLDMESLRAIPAVKEGFKALSLAPLNAFFIGPMVEVAERSPSLCLGVYQEGNNFLATIRMGRGRQGMAERVAYLLPGDERGSLPLLKPANALASLSFYLDLGRVWDNRAKLLGKNELKGLEDLDSKSGIFLGGIKLSKLLKQAGSHHRLVVVQPTKSTYQTKPNQPLPGFAWVIEMGDPAFGKSMDTVLRAAAFLATTQFNLKMVEEKHGPHTIVSYRFPENKDLPGDSTKFDLLRLNLSPCFVAVGNQFIICSTVELGREMAELVAREASGPASPATTRVQLYAAGGAVALRAAQEQIRTQFILGQAFSPKTAQEQVQQLIALVERLGVLELEFHYGSKDFRYDARLNLGK